MSPQAFGWQYSSRSCKTDLEGSGTCPTQSIDFITLLKEVLDKAGAVAELGAAAIGVALAANPVDSRCWGREESIPSSQLTHKYGSLAWRYEARQTTVKHHYCGNPTRPTSTCLCCYECDRPEEGVIVKRVVTMPCEMGRPPSYPCRLLPSRPPCRTPGDRGEDDVWRS